MSLSLSQSSMDYDYDKPSPSTMMKTYNMYYTTSRLNVKIHLGPSSSAPCVYYGESNFITPKPCIQLRAGDSKSAPVVALAKLHITSRHVQIGVVGSGDDLSDAKKGANQHDKSSFEWAEMRREHFRLKRSDYEFDTSVGLGGSSGGDNSQQRQTFGWKVEKSCYKTVYSCVDDAGRVVANLRSGGMCNWKKGGEIDVMEDLDPRLEHLLIVSALAIFSSEAGWSVSKGYDSNSSSGKDGART